MEIHLMHEPVLDTGRGRTIIFLPGVGFELMQWGKLIKNLSATYRILIPSLPSHANSFTVNTLSALLDFLDEFIKMCNDKVILLGCGIDGELALHYTKIYPKMVKQLIFVRAFDSENRSEIEMAIDLCKLRHNVGDGDHFQTGMASWHRRIPAWYIETLFNRIRPQGVPSILLLRDLTVSSNGPEKGKIQFLPNAPLISQMDLITPISDFLNGNGRIA